MFVQRENMVSHNTYSPENRFAHPRVSRCALETLIFYRVYDVVVFSSPGPKLIVYKGIRGPSVRPSVVRLSTFSNDISSEAVRPILLIFHI